MYLLLGSLIWFGVWIVRHLASASTSHCTYMKHFPTKMQNHASVTVPLLCIWKVLEALLHTQADGSPRFRVAYRFRNPKAAFETKS